MTLRVRIDPAHVASAGCAGLLAEGGEWRQALRALARHGGLDAVPDEVFLHAYAYEVAERLRGAAAGGAEVALPLWPACLFPAAEVAAHGARELERLHPPLAVTWVARTADQVAAEAERVLGALRFDPERYLDALAGTAAERGFTSVPGGLAPERSTSAVVLLREGALLLERRPAQARVYAGLWDTPGGHVRPGETPSAALRREASEELGVDVCAAWLALVQDDQDRTSGVRYRHFSWVVNAHFGEPRAREGQELAWVPLPQVPARDDVNPLVAALLRDQALVRQGLGICGAS